jgi:predicted Fe-S protein YdhL (DUF1289 family)
VTSVESPCRKVCDYDSGCGWCRSCGRTLAEIGGWLDAGDAEKRAIVARAERRLVNP